MIISIKNILLNLFLNYMIMKNSIFILSAMLILGACSSDSAQKVTEKIKNAYYSKDKLPYHGS